MDNLVKKIKTVAGRQARIVISDDNWLEDAAVEQFKQTMTLDGMRVGVGMPDIHPGKGQPIGAAFIAENCIYPHLVGSDIGCGMGLWQLDIPVRKVKLDKWEKQLYNLDDLWDGNTAEYLLGKNVVTDDPILLSENNKLGTIGGGNHFAELQQVDTVIDSKVFAMANLNKQHVALLVHSGSRGLGQKLLRQHIDQFGAVPILTNDDGKQYKDYIRRHDHAVDWAVINRELIAHRICECLKTQKTPLLDITHNMVEPLCDRKGLSMALANDKNQQYWIHRKGASPTDKGLVMIPGSRGSLSYLVKPKLNRFFNLAQGGFSLAHGAGRKWKRSDARGRLEQRYKVKDLEKTALGSRVICKQRNLLYEEAPQAYKNISQVINDLVDAEMIDVVATFKPLLTYKTRRT
ncbi:MAG: RNA ligase RtcB family protein [Cellvibrionaceae bacterium]